MKARTGDKVRLRSGEYRGVRALVESVDGAKLKIRLGGSKMIIKVLAEEVTNFSLAARKAWATNPDRAVGRREGTRFCDRVSVTLRIDRDLWERFVGMESAGVIEDRTSVVNDWFREKLGKMNSMELQS